MPRNSPREGGSLLIASISGRALAEAARRAGFTPLVADFFADADTQETAHACRKLTGIGRGFRWQSLYPALSALAELAPTPVLGLVYGSGFEDRPELLRLIAKRWPLLGTGAATVARLKSPEDFFPALDRLGIAHPPTQSEPPPRGGTWLAKTWLAKTWLAKKRGGAGGSHIVPSRLAKASAHIYFQERAAGRAVSALFIANGSGARVLGFSEQWTSPRPSSPWRYGGAVCPARVSPSLARKMTASVKKLARVYPIKGIASADFLLRDEEPLLLEINPRPGATLDIFDRGRRPLLSLAYGSGAGRQIAVTRAEAPRRHGLGHRLCRAALAGPRGRSLARLGWRPAEAIGMDRQEPSDMHCVGARRHGRRSETLGRGATA